MYSLYSFYFKNKPLACLCSCVAQTCFLASRHCLFVHVGNGQDVLPAGTVRGHVASPVSIITGTSSYKSDPKFTPNI